MSRYDYEISADEITPYIIEDKKGTYRLRTRKDGGLQGPVFFKNILTEKHGFEVNIYFYNFLSAQHLIILYRCLSPASKQPQ